jgi:hypothetical protein
MRTHYEDLHVTEDAPDEVIRAAYRSLSLKHHPDTSGDRPQSKATCAPLGRHPLAGCLVDGEEIMGLSIDTLSMYHPAP